METTELIKTFHDFFEKEYYDVLLNNSTKDEKSLVIDFSIMSKFDPELAEVLLENPIETIKAGELTIEKLDLPNENKNIKLRFKNLPSSIETDISHIRSKHIGKFLVIEGIIKQKSEVRPLTTSARFECPSCGNVIPILQLDQSFREPTKCGCGRKGKFRLLSKELVDCQGMVIEENPETLFGNIQPRRLTVLLQEDLVKPIKDKKNNPGSKVRVCGIIKEVPIYIQKSKSTKSDIILEANYIEAKEEDYSEINFTEDDIKKIKKLSKDPNLYVMLRDSFAPTMYGHDKIKDALLLQMVSGIKKESKDMVKRRSDIHILLIGDPGTGKSQFLKRASAVAPKSRYVSGKGASGAGLTAAVVKDEFLKGWSLEAGSLVLTNKGICMIDELDKMTKEDRDAMHEALEQQTITVAKANIQATLRCETTVLAAANPKHGRFDPYETIARQIDLPASLISRFDLIFPIRDIPKRENDLCMAFFIADLHMNEAGKEAKISTEFLRKYLSYAKQNCKPKLTQEAVDDMAEYFASIRNNGFNGDEIKAIPITARQLEGLIRLAEASAKMRLSKEVNKFDMKRAIDLLHSCLVEVGIDPNTGQIDIDKIETGTTTNERNTMHIVKSIIKDLEAELNSKIIEINHIEKIAANQDLTEDSLNEIIIKLKKNGDIYEPKRGFISRYS